MISCDKPMKCTITIYVTTSTFMVSIQTQKLNIYIMIWLLEITSIIYNMEFTVNDLQKHFEACPIVSNITTNYPRPIASIYEKNPKYSPTKVHEE